MTTSYTHQATTSQQQREAVASPFSVTIPVDAMEKAGQDLGLADRPLVSNANKGVTQVRGGFDLHRQHRYEMREYLQDITTMKRVQSCGLVSYMTDGVVEVRYRNGVAGYHGVTTCGSVWACPVCSAKIQSARRQEVQAVLDWAISQGLVLGFGTMTLRHNKNQPLAKIWGGLGACFRAVRTDRAVRNRRSWFMADIDTGVSTMPYIRTQEVTYSYENGWHPHVHMVYFFRPGTTQEDVDALADNEFKVWKRTALAEGLGEPLRDLYEIKLLNPQDSADVTEDVQRVANYLTKATLGQPAQEAPKESLSQVIKGTSYEMQGSMTKKARAGSRTPAQILHDVYETNNADDMELWWEYEKVSKGRHSLDYSRGLLDLVGVRQRSDEEVAAEDVGGRRDTVAALARWGRDVACGRSALGSRLLDAARAGGQAADLDAVELYPDEDEWSLEQRRLYGLAGARACVEDFCQYYEIETLPLDSPALKRARHKEDKLVREMRRRGGYYDMVPELDKARRDWEWLDEEFSALVADVDDARDGWFRSDLDIDEALEVTMNDQGKRFMVWMWDGVYNAYGSHGGPLTSDPALRKWAVVEDFKSAMDEARDLLDLLDDDCPGSAREAYREKEGLAVFNSTSVVEKIRRHVYRARGILKQLTASVLRDQNLLTGPAATKACLAAPIGCDDDGICRRGIWQGDSSYKMWGVVFNNALYQFIQERRNAGYDVSELVEFFEQWQDECSDVRSEHIAKAREKRAEKLKWETEFGREDGQTVLALA